jgi:sulfite reductase alpha subunit-like flavoprotein
VLEETTVDKLKNVVDPLSKDPRYYQARVKANERITASDWYQDVRHFEFEYQGDIKYDPGDVAIIHPVATNDDVDSFLEIVRWSDRADVPCVIRRHVEGMIRLPCLHSGS